MTTKKSGKEFDVVEMKRRASRAIHERLKDKDMSERFSYWQERTEALRQRQSDQRDPSEN
jgi:hypothetical protein